MQEMNCYALKNNVVGNHNQISKPLLHSYLQYKEKYMLIQQLYLQCQSTH